MTTVPIDSRDADTGRLVRRWTDATASDQHLNFTSPSVTSDDRWLMIISDRSGSPNLWAIDRQTRSMRQISFCTSLRCSYVYPFGGDDGFNKTSPFLVADRNLVYWVQDDDVMRCRLDGGRPEHVSTLPKGYLGAFTHCSSDGSTFCVPCSDARAYYAGDPDQLAQLHSVSHRLVANGWHTKLCFIDTTTGVCEVRAEIPFWVSHVQFPFGRSDRLVFNSEAMYLMTGDPHTRIWRLDEHNRFRKLFDQPQTINVNHENFSPDGSVICYHGSDVDGRSNKFVEARTWDGELVWHADVPNVNVFHSTLMRDPRVCAIDDTDGWINILTLHEDNTYEVKHLCRHDSSWADQDVHPHPTLTPSGKGLIFCSDREGNGNVYEVLLEQ